MNKNVRDVGFLLCTDHDSLVGTVFYFTASFKSCGVSTSCSALATCMCSVTHYRSIGFSNSALPLNFEIFLDNVNAKHLVYQKSVS